MKKLRKTITAKFKMPCLYRDDLQEIETILCETPGLKDFEIETGGFQYGSINEISSDKPSTHIIQIYASSPYIRISFDGFGAEIYGSDEDETKAVGIINRISEVVRRRERRFRWFNARVLTWIFAFFLGPLVSELAYSIGRGRNFSFIENYAVVLVLIVICLTISAKDSFFSFSQIYFKSRSNTPSWLKKNKDQIIVQVISSLVVGIIGFFIGHAIK